MDDAGSSRAANTISLLIMVLIAVSCVAFVVETIPEIYASESAKAVLSTIEAVCSILFTIEYLLRFFSAPDKIAFLKGVLNFVDLIAVAPWRNTPRRNSSGYARFRLPYFFEDSEYTIALNASIQNDMTFSCGSVKVSPTRLSS